MKLTLKNQSDSAKILLVSCDIALRDNVSAELREGNYRVETADSAQMVSEVLRRESIDVALVDCRAPGSVGPEAARLVRQNSVATEIIVLIGDTDATAVSATDREGAFDSLALPIPGPQLLAKVKKAFEHRRMKQELTLLRQHVAMAYGFDNIIGESKAVVQLKETARRIAPTDIPILITGEDGTGKELLARTIHHHSSRRRQNLAAVDCTTIPEALLEEELFGRREAAQPGTDGKKGLLEQADGGTIYLENINDLAVSVQAQLVRLFQYSEITPLGATAPVRVNLRVIASTSTDLAALIADDRFRRELFNYVSVITLNVPTLKERAEDIQLLSDYFLRKITQEQNLPDLTVNRQAREMLLGAPWPGNIRQLENVLKRAAALCRNGHIEADDIIFINAAGPESGTPEISPPNRVVGSRGLLADSQRAVIIKALEDNDWNFTQTAQMLGIGRTTLWRKVRKYRLRRDTVPVAEDEKAASR